MCNFDQFYVRQRSIILRCGPSPHAYILVGGMENTLARLLRRLWKDDQGQDIAEYAVMLAVILVLVVGTVRLVGSSANTAFSSVASSLQ